MIDHELRQLGIDPESNDYEVCDKTRALEIIIGMFYYHRNFEFGDIWPVDELEPDEIVWLITHNGKRAAYLLDDGRFLVPTDW